MTNPQPPAKRKRKKALAPGKPRLSMMEQQLLEEGGDDVIWDRLVNGESIADIMGTYGFSRAYFYTWLKNGGPERRAKFEEAKAMSADAHAEKGMQILDNPEPVFSSAEVTLRQHRANYRKWYAGTLNQQYRDGPQVQVNNLSVGDLQLASLQKHGFVPFSEIQNTQEGDEDDEG